MPVLQSDCPLRHQGKHPSGFPVQTYPGAQLPMGPQAFWELVEEPAFRQTAPPGLVPGFPIGKQPSPLAHDDGLCGEQLSEQKLRAVHGPE